MAGAVVVLTNLFDDPNQVSANSAAEMTEAAKVSAMADEWRGAVDYSPAYAALSPYAEITTEGAFVAFDPADDYWGLPREAGVETVSAYCSACHTMQIVMTQRQSREGWDYLLTWMVEKQGMSPPAKDTREEILDYLSNALGER